jgi:RecB family exonuclease
VIKYVSASQITTFRDCPRKWYFDKIIGLERPATTATALGSEVHEVLEEYLKNGTPPPDTEAGEIASSGLHLLPESDHVEIELSLADDMPLTDAPVQVVGYVDAIYPQAHQILDHKTSSNKRYTKTARELAVNVQLILYARAYLDKHDAQNITLTHVYYGTRSRWSKRVDVSVTREHILEQWSEIRSDIEQMVAVSEIDRASDVTPCRDSCDKYGGCPFVGQCFRAQHFQRNPNHEPEPTKRQNNMMTPEERMKQLGLSFDAPKPKHAPKATPKPSPAPAQSVASGQRILFIGCVALKGATPAQNALDVYAEPIRELCKKLKVPHLALVDYGKGWSALVGAVSEMGWPSNVDAIYLDPISKEYEHLVSVLSGLADIVIKRV